MKLGNLCVSRFAILAVLAWSRGAYVAVEQPQSSCMTSHPRVQWLFNMAALGKLPTWVIQRLWMGTEEYGGCSPKPTQLFGDAPYLVMMGNKLSKGDREHCARCMKSVTRRCKDKKGVRRCAGGAMQKYGLNRCVR